MLGFSDDKKLTMYFRLAYYVGFHLFGVVTLLPWIVRSRTWGPVVDSDGQSRTWWYGRNTASDVASC